MTAELELFTWDDTAKTYASGVKKTFADWGIDQDQVTGAFREQVADEMNLTCSGRALLAAQFAYRSKVIITLDEAPFFCGYVKDDPREGDGNTNRERIALAGPWWFLEDLLYQQTRLRLTGVDGSGDPVYATDYLTQFTLNLPLTPTFSDIVFPSVSYSVTQLDSRAQIKAVLDYAIARGAWLAYAETDLLQVPVLPADVLNITCAEAIRRQLEDVDAVAWFDHTQTPPKFHVQRRKDLPNYARGLGEAKQAQGFNLKRRYDLAVPYVQINFQQPFSVGSYHTVYNEVDLYPNPAPADDFKALVTTVPLRSINGTVHTKYIKTDTVDPSSLDWWKRRKPELDASINPKATTDYADLSLVAGTDNRAVISGTAGLPNMIVDGGYADWMAGSIGDEQITVQAKYHRKFDANRNGTKISAHTFRAHCRTTDLSFPSGINFTYTEFTDLGEDISFYTGMAQTIYEDLTAPQYEGAIPVFEKTFSGEVVLGKNFNLTGGLAEWATMNALVREIRFRIRPGGIFYTLTVGPNKHLSIQQLRDRLRAARTRYITAVNFGPGGSQTTIQLTKHSASDTLSSAEPAVTDYAVNDQNGDASAVGQVFLSGNAGAPQIGFVTLKTDGSVDTTLPRVTLKASDITNGRAL